MLPSSDGLHDVACDDIIAVRALKTARADMATVRRARLIRAMEKLRV